MSDDAFGVSAAALRESVRAVPATLLLVDVQSGRIVECSDRATELLAGSREAVVGTEFADWLRGGTGDAGIVDAAVAADGPVTRGARLTTRDGAVDCELEASVARDGDRATCTVTVDTDLSERSEETESDVASRFEALFEAPASFVTLLDPDGTLRRANENALAFVDVAPDAVRGRPLPETPWWSHSAELQSNLRDWIEAAAEGRAVRYEAEHRNANGETVTVDGVLQPVTRDGEVTALLTIGRDISRRKHLEDQLKEREESFRELYNVLSAPDPSFEGKLERVFDLGRDRLGVELGFLTRIEDDVQEIEAAAGDHPLISPGESCPLSEAYCKKTVERDELLSVHDAPAAGWEGTPAYETFELGSYIGCKVLVRNELYGTLCFADSSPRERSFTEAERTFVELLTQWVSYELTQEQAQRELQRQNERLDRFADVVSHDLRNPLQTATGHLELARERYDDDNLDTVAEMHARMEQLIEDVLAVAQGGQEVPPADREDVSLFSVAQAAWETAGDDAAALTLDGDDAVVRCDESRLRQLFENLFRNAVEHGTDDGGLTVHVGALDGDANEFDSNPGFYVADDGPGIPEGEREKVFEDGFSDGGSTGLGLTIVEEVAAAHGWTVSVGGSESGGARFEVRDAE
ncbi:sensor histidine kinase [Halostella litorea]|uniref:sensor histidine kinase n=1 Tax=Halostella litorea TaxID=2528831 RepID=UPI0010919BDE|nr:ATP-binding protein [Halostella litorea]